MPVYNYRCESCEHQFEEVKKISEYKIPCEEPCPECGKDNSVIIHIGAAPAFSKTGAKTNLRVSDDFNHVLKRIDRFYKRTGSRIETN